MNQKIVLFASLLLAGSLWADEYVMTNNETLVVNESNKASFADGIDVKGKDAILQLELDDAPTFNIRASGYNRSASLIKANDKNWTLTKSISEYWGAYEIQGGVVTVEAEAAFGYIWEGLPVYIRSGATVVFKKAKCYQRGRVFHLAGTGVGGRGAIEFGAHCDQYTCPNICLDDDALIKSDSYYCMPSRLDPQGHTLTVDLNGQTVYNFGTLGTGNLTLLNGTQYAVRGVKASVAADAAGTITLTSTESKTPKFFFSQGVTNGVVARPINITGNAAITINDTTLPTTAFSTNVFRFTEPVTFVNTSGAGRLSLAVSSSENESGSIRQLSFFGPITGPGAVAVESNPYTHNGRIYLAHSANTFAGGLSLNAYNGRRYGTILAAYPGSLGGDGSSYSSVNVKKGSIDCEVAEDGSKWTLSSFAKLVNEATWGDGHYSTARLWTHLCANVPSLAASGISMTNCWGTSGDVIFSYDKPEDADGLCVWFGRVHPRCNEPLALKNMNLGGDTFIHCDSTGMPIASAVILDGGTKVEIGEEPFYIVNRTMTYASNVVRVIVRDAEITTTTTDIPAAYSSVNARALVVGGSTSWYMGILEIQDGAVISNKLIVGAGNDATYGVNYDWDRGAVYQHGGKVYAIGATSSQHLDSGIGMGSHGIASYQMHGGTFEACGNFSIGMYSPATWTQFGGSTTFRKRNGKGGHYIAGGNGGRAGVALFGGTMSFEGDVSVQASTTGNTDGSFLAVDGTDAQFSANGNLSFNASSDVNPAIVSVNRGGTLAVQTIGQAQAKAHTVSKQRLDISFDGGILKTLASSKNVFRSADGAPDSVTVCAGGLTVDTAGQIGNVIGVPLVPPAGSGVVSIAYDSPIVSRHLAGAPLVYIDGDGYGAAAVALWDPVACAVTNLRVTAAGFGYTTATVRIPISGESTAWTYACTLGDNAQTGGFTKKGAGDLTLSATNAWGGATILAGGTLKAACDWAIPSNAVVRLEGGNLDFNGKTGSVSQVAYGVGGGAILNAANVALPGTATMSISFDEILAGKTVSVAAGTDLSTIAISVTGDVPALDPSVQKRYRFVTVSGGVCSGTPTITSQTLPGRWRFVARPTGVQLVHCDGMAFIIR